ncbi:MAG: hypothetical protein AAF958_19535 [Planctomycetota bacterium]
MKVGPATPSVYDRRMKAWESSRWWVRVSGAEEKTIRELRSPYALIGRHDSCQIRLADPHAPDVAYIAVCFPDAVEVWPVCPLAYSMWGIARPDLELLIGRSKVSFDSEIADTRPDLDDMEAAVIASDQEAADAPVRLMLDWGQGTVHKKIRRRITIVGGDHPSIIRIHGRNLRRCSCAIVRQNGTLWWINLDPMALRRGAPEWKCLDEMEQPIAIGTLHLWSENAAIDGTSIQPLSGSAIDALMGSTSVTDIAGSVENIAGQSQAEATSIRPSDSATKLKVARKRDPARQAIPEIGAPKFRQEKKSAQGASPQNQANIKTGTFPSEKSQPGNRKSADGRDRSAILAAAATRPITPQDTPSLEENDIDASILTDRIIARGREKSAQQRLVSRIAVIALLMFSTIAFLWILVRILLPMVIEMTPENVDNLAG